MLKHIVFVIHRLERTEFTVLSAKGIVSNLSQSDIDHILPIFEHIPECEDADGNSIFDNTIRNYIGQDISIQINTGSVKGYFDTFSSFIQKNKTALKQDEFYVRDIDALYQGDKKQHGNLDAYFKNIALITLLREVADYEKQIGSDLELFFYKAEKGLTLNINYLVENLDGLFLNKLNDLKTQFSSSHDREERKQIFINELINLLNDENSYVVLLVKWEVLINNYEKSFKLYLEGFSFDKIKTASTHYLQELTDRIFDQINKATTNIFIVPAAYIFLIKSFELTGGLLQNVLLLVTAFIFSLIMHRVVFANMCENLNVIKSDIASFREKIQETESLKTALDGLENTKIDQQVGKIRLLKWCNWILFIFAAITFLYTDYSEIVCFIRVFMETIQ